MYNAIMNSVKAKKTKKSVTYQFPISVVQRLREWKEKNQHHSINSFVVDSVIEKLDRETNGG